MKKEEINLGDLGRARFAEFCKIIKDLVYNQKIPFDLIIGVGNSGSALAKTTSMIYQMLQIPSPEILYIPMYRYMPGHEDDEAFKFDKQYYYPQINNFVKKYEPGLKNILLVDDEIGMGLGSLNVFSLFKQSCKENGKQDSFNFYIVAENQGFVPPAEYPQIEFVPFGHRVEGLFNVIFYVTPSELEEPIIDVFGDDDAFPFHWRTNLLLNLPNKEFNNGQPRFTDRYLIRANEQIPNFNVMQKRYKTFLVGLIQDSLK